MNKWLDSPRPMRFSTTLIGFLCALCILAQKPVERDYSITFTGPISQAQEKFVHEGLRAQDPSMLIWVEHPLNQVLARTITQLDRDEFVVAIAPSGLVIAQMGVVQHHVAMTRSLDIENQEPYPTYVDTGDPVLDNAHYEVAKQAWVIAHPSGYDALRIAVPE